MENVNDFINWLWSIDPNLGKTVQSRYHSYEQALQEQNAQRGCMNSGNSTVIIDGRYLIQRDRQGLSLFYLRERGNGLMAIYQDEASLCADLIADSIRRNHCVSLTEFIHENQRLLSLCRQGLGSLGYGEKA
ncbi:DUF5405 family protein [Edwardsiella tarda]|uniref:DUF5405 family protein n=1 Tax=Edwardsiella tarda TaxID=636 RepID=UPI0024444EBB|nr:DUF5405 family protein [Edwardsiella tarda]WGE29432.1 DUF5405 family protein [Edwardsiella tarda]